MGILGGKSGSDLTACHKRIWLHIKQSRFLRFIIHFLTNEREPMKCLAVKGEIWDLLEIWIPKI